MEKPGIRYCWPIAFALCLLAGCTHKPEPAIRLAINPWPGYEFLFLAAQQGYFKEVGLDVELIPFNSLSDAQRAYIGGRVDGFASTMIEAVQSQVLSRRPLQVVMVPDYSNGGDVVIARKPIASPADLKGKRIGAEVSSLGIYMLHRTLASAGLTLADIELANIEQIRGPQAFSDGLIDAYVTYPPFSVKILEDPATRVIFTSAQIPYDIIDTISISTDTLQSHPQLVPKLYRAWQMALDYARDNPQRAHALMATRQGISVEAFTAALDDIHVIDSVEQYRLFSQPDALQQKAVDVCNVLTAVEAIRFDCQTLPFIIYRAPQP